MPASALSSDRRAETESGVLDVLVHRWSPRGFDATETIDETKLRCALEAARWSPSASNTQPWRFIVARRGTQEHASVLASLMGFNTVWAGDAAVLIVAIAEQSNEQGDSMRWAAYDVGQAMAHLSVQAHHDGLHVHQMGGFDGAALSEAFGLDARFAPVTVAALGTLGSTTHLPEALQEREVAPRARRALADSVIVDA